MSTTPHNNAPIGSITPVVLMPGDPNRAKLIADKYLKNVKVLSDVRGIGVYVGTYNGVKLTIMPHGMGVPSAGIYMYELFNVYKVKTIIRIGTCGGYSSKLKLGELFVATETWSNSPFANEIGIKPKNNVLTCSKQLLDDFKKLNNDDKNILYGRVHCTDTFYNNSSLKDNIANTKADAVEMESFALYATAQKFKANGLALFYCSDHLLTKESMSANERTTNVDKLIQKGLELACFEAKKYQ